MWEGAKLDPVHTSLTFNRCLLTAEQESGDPYSVGSDYGYYFFSSQPFLRVDANGERFHNESAPYDFVMNAMTKYPEGQRTWHQVWDANWQENVQRFHTVGCSTICYREGADHDAFPTMMDDWIGPEMESFVEAGYIVKADTLEELAEKLGFADEKKEAFLATCERQNENFDAQVDPDFGKEAFRLSELRTAPFYATVKSCALTLCTLDGIVVNEKCQPYGADGAVIEAYASWEMTRDASMQAHTPIRRRGSMPDAVRRSAAWLAKNSPKPRWLTAAASYKTTKTTTRQTPNRQEKSHSEA